MAPDTVNKYRQSNSERPRDLSNVSGMGADTQGVIWKDTTEIQILDFQGPPVLRQRPAIPLGMMIPEESSRAAGC